MVRISELARRVGLSRTTLAHEDILRLRWLSRSYTGHEDDMKDFLKIFEGLDCHGPATREDTLAALALVPERPATILDIGCGPGNASLILAERTEAHVHGLDNLDQSLRRIEERAASAGLSSRVTAVNGDMAVLPFPGQTFDLLWCENGVYIIGFEEALQAWKPFIAKGGTLVVSDLLWLIEDPAEDVKAFWKDEYPGMTTMGVRREQIERLGYDLLATHALGHAAWAAYYGPLAERVESLRDEMKDSEAILSMDREIPMLRRQADGEFNYVFFVLRPRR